MLKKISAAIRNRNEANRPFCTAVVAAGGSSSRMGADKLMYKLRGIPVLVRTLQRLEACSVIHEIIVAVRPEAIEETVSLLAEYKISKLTKVIAGGDSRLVTVYNGVMEASREAEIIAVHDGARPLVSDLVIKNALDMGSLFSCAVPCVPVKDTLKEAAGDKAVNTPDRSRFYLAQTPQVFEKSLIKCALANAIKKNLPVTDDASAVEALGFRVHISRGDYRNIKLTTPEDLLIAEAFLAEEEKCCE